MMSLVCLNVGGDGLRPLRDFGAQSRFCAAVRSGADGSAVHNQARGPATLEPLAKGGVSMNELERLEAMFRARPASPSIEQGRVANDALGDRFPLAADVRVEPVEARGVPAEWTSTPVACTREVILYLHGGGYVWGSLKS